MCCMSPLWVRTCILYSGLASAPCTELLTVWWTYCTETLWTLSYHKAEVKSDCVSVNELSMSMAKAPALSALVTLEKEESREREKQRKAFIFMSPNLLQLYVRVQARTGRGGGAGERIAGAMAGCSMVAFFPFCGDTDNTHTYTATPGGFPPGVPKWSNTTYHCLITPVPKDRREECREVFPWSTTQEVHCISLRDCGPLYDVYTFLKKKTFVRVCLDRGGEW